MAGEHEMEEDDLVPDFALGPKVALALEEVTFQSA